MSWRCGDGGVALTSTVVNPHDSNTDSDGSQTCAPRNPDGAIKVTVDVCRHVDDEVVAAMARLIPQLSSSNPPPGRCELEEIVASDATTLFVARQHDHIVGALTMVAFRIPTGMRTRIEDVVVDEAFRGRRVGEQLTRAALQAAQRMGAHSTDLTSRPSRPEANRLYTRMGFQRRDSNVYRYTP